MGFAISAKTAYTAAAGMSLISFLCLLLVNLGTPIIKSIYIASYGDHEDGKRLFGIYGECTQFYSKSNDFTVYEYQCENNFEHSNIFDGTKFLLIMHAIGAITSFMLLYIGIYARNHVHSHVVNKSMTWVFALFNSLIVLLAMSGQIDMFSKLQDWFKDNASPLKFGDGGLSPVITSLIFSLLSVLAFYKGDQAVSEGGGDINGSNDNENMNTVMTNQQKPVPQQSQIPQSYLNPQSDTDHQPYLSTNDQPVV
nr:14145_t:CDS:2 [Entrophospora candida]